MSAPPMLGPGIGHAPLGPPALRFDLNRTAPSLYTLTGITRDSAGAPLGNCTVDLFYSGGDKQRFASTVSDAAGAYTFIGGDNVTTFFAVFYKPGSPAVAGTTVNTLQFS